jgi:hypothetical protein
MTPSNATQEIIVYGWSKTANVDFFSLENKFSWSFNYLWWKEISSNPPCASKVVCTSIFFYRWVTFWIWIKSYLLQFSMDFSTFFFKWSLECVSITVQNFSTVPIFEVEKKKFCLPRRHFQDQNSYIFTYILVIFFDFGSLYCFLTLCKFLCP